MGLFKQMKDMKKTVEATPGLMAQAQQMGAQAQQLQAAQHAAMQQQQAAVAPPADGAFFEPIAGVSIELYADISRECAVRPGDLGHAASSAAGRGVSNECWQAAMDGWNARTHNPSVAQRFHARYMQRG